MAKEGFIPSELKLIEDAYAYLSGIGFDPQISLNFIHFSIELQKVNLQARMIAKASEIDQETLIKRIAEMVIRTLDERNQLNGESKT